MTIKTGQNINADDFLASFVAGEAIADGDAVAFYHSDKKVYKASAAALNERLNFIGFAVGGVSAGAACKVNTMPVAYKTVVANTIYYLSNTQGAIATSPGTISREIGIGLGTTRIWRWKNGRVVSPPISTGGNFTSPVNGIVSYFQAGVYITVDTIGQSFGTSNGAFRQVTAPVKPGSVVTFANAGGADTYGPMITILDI
jgi:hypothetical protein